MMMPYASDKDKNPADKSEAGFTLVEVLISLTSLIVPGLF